MAGLFDTTSLFNNGTGNGYSSLMNLGSLSNTANNALNSSNIFNLGSTDLYNQTMQDYNQLGSGTGTNVTEPTTSQGFGWNNDTFQGIGTIMQGIGSLGSLYTGLQQLSLARDSYNLQKDAYNTNLANSVSEYNTNLEDKIRGRTSDYSGKEADVQSYLSSHKLST